MLRSRSRKRSKSPVKIFAAPVVAFREIHQLPSNAGRPREASELAQPAGHFPMMVAVGKLGALFARRYQAKPAYQPRLRSNCAGRRT